MKVKLPLTLIDVLNGTTKKVRVSLLDACDGCGGSGAAQGTRPQPCGTCGGSGEERVVHNGFMGQMVSVHYAGWLTDGTPFDNSFQRGSPSDFRLGQVIQGWNEGLQLMKPGAIYRLVIPADLGYGKRGSPPTIPGGATLVFHVELLAVK